MGHGAWGMEQRAEGKGQRAKGREHRSQNSGARKLRTFSNMYIIYTFHPSGLRFVEPTPWREAGKAEDRLSSQSYPILAYSGQFFQEIGKGLQLGTQPWPQYWEGRH